MAKRGLTKLQKDTLDCLAQGMKTKEIAEKLNCSESSVKSIRINKDLKRAYSQACQEEIRNAVPTAIRELVKILDDPLSGDNSKIAASKQILALSKITDNIDTDQDIKVNIVYR